MEMTQVTSSFIRAIGFEPSSPDDQAGAGTVTIEFNDGATFTYDGPTLADFHALLNAPSVGSYFHRIFKKQFVGVRA